MQTSALRLGEIMRKHAKLVYSLAYSRTQNHADAEDIFQEVFLRLAQRTEPFQSDEHTKAWLIRVTANLSTNLIASAWRRHVTLRDYLPEHREARKADDGFDLDAAMKRLGEKDRMVLFLRYYEEMTAEEIAKALQESLPAVRKRLTLAKGKLGKLLQEQSGKEKQNVCDQI